MKTHKRSPLIVLTVCLISIGILSFSDPVFAKRITSLSQAAKTATAAVKNADVTEVDSDYEKGQLIYEIQLIKGAKKYDITYRASDGKMLSYGWEIYRPQQSSKKKIMNRSNCQKLALKEVPGAKILSLVQKSDDGIPIYKVKLTHSNKKYTLKYHARTGKLLEYEWELTVSTQKNPTTSKYIGVAKAKKIALARVPNATVVKAGFDQDDGVPVYEIELIKGAMEYDIKIHARSGKILEFEKDYNDSWW